LAKIAFLGLKCGEKPILSSKNTAGPAIAGLSDMTEYAKIIPKGFLEALF